MKNRKESKIALLVTIGMILLFILFLFYQNFHDIGYREEKCSQDILEKAKLYYQETGTDPETVVLDMFYDDCMRDAGWIK
ncbi:hypothetical protein HN784_02805 [bacterium]|nr:hypothetical protein [bacterium]MBT7037539.1 hypothetical protein [bacterium]MBT7431744.1 hypothetical protein [bacterium]MBT7992725.1 hypothetical protein [bacterium]